MDGSQLQESPDKCELLLGCYIESNLKWHRHISELLKKLQLRINALEKLRSTLPFIHKRIIVEGLFTSVLMYCFPFFGRCDKLELDVLQTMQNKACKTMLE